jgi:starch synthase (maltosyl-transferring)
MNNITTQKKRSRVVIASVLPHVDSGRFAIKRTVGETVQVKATILCDGQDVLNCQLLYRSEKTPIWSRVTMLCDGNDGWRAQFQVTQLGKYFFTVEASLDRLATWLRDFRKKVEAHQWEEVDVKTGALLLKKIAKGLPAAQAEIFAGWEKFLNSSPRASDFPRFFENEKELKLIAERVPDASLVQYSVELPVIVDPVHAAHAAWYEFFPRSFSTVPGKHGTFATSEKHLEYVQAMGFDIVYLPPIHPIGKTFRKGRNNVTTAQPRDSGSPWAIGSHEGGFCSVHPELGSLADFKHFLEKADHLGLKIALDLAFQCSPDHPYVKEHPEWFKQRPNGTIQYAENPPKKYQDIYPFDFECDAPDLLWEELKSVVFYWIKNGIKIFRVDNPHTKPFHFWEWLISEVRKAHPEVLFLAEAFSRPNIMSYLAKVGFNQSYTYFTWRTSKQDLIEYFSELTHTDLIEYFRPNLWPNTPDILSEELQIGGRPAFIRRLILAATLSSSYGIYGPAYELCEALSKEKNSEEYLNSEKFELKKWDLNQKHSLAPLITRLNQIRKENKALASNQQLRFLPISNDHLIAYSKSSQDGTNHFVVIVNLSSTEKAAGILDLPLENFGLMPGVPYLMRDLLTGKCYEWKDWKNYVELDPALMPAHLFVLEKQAH